MKFKKATHHLKWGENKREGKYPNFVVYDFVFGNTAVPFILVAISF